MSKRFPKPVKFSPKNPNKYKGDSTEIWSRSSWESRVMYWLDNNPKVIWWSSEEVKIPYISPADQRIHHYYPDFFLQVKTNSGELKIHMWEVKPDKQTRFPEGNKKSKKVLMEAETYIINQAKWKAAEMFCKKQGWTFSVITEKDLGLIPK